MTPNTKLTAKIFAQKRAAWSYRGSFLASARLFNTTMSNASPIVTCGKR